MTHYILDQTGREMSWHRCAEAYADALTMIAEVPESRMMVTCWVTGGFSIRGLTIRCKEWAMSGCSVVGGCDE